MTEIETKVITTIRESKDPVKAMAVASDILERMVAGESPESITAIQREQTND